MDLDAAVFSLWDGGISWVEITLPTPGALRAVTRLSAAVPAGCRVGVGTVTDEKSARAALDAGAQFLVTPTFDHQVVELAVSRGLPVFPGAYTPTEILTAWRAGATAVKIFRAEQLGPDYIGNLLAPMPELRMIPTGGVALVNLPDWLRAGATAVGVGSAVVRRDFMEAEDWDGLCYAAREWVERSRIE